MYSLPGMCEKLSEESTVNFPFIKERMLNVFYISVNDRYDFLPEQIEEKGFVIGANIVRVMAEVCVCRR